MMAIEPRARASGASCDQEALQERVLRASVRAAFQIRPLPTTFARNTRGTASRALRSQQSWYGGLPTCAGVGYENVRIASDPLPLQRLSNSCELATTVLLGVDSHN